MVVALLLLFVGHAYGALLTAAQATATGAGPSPRQAGAPTTTPITTPFTSSGSKFGTFGWYAADILANSTTWLPYTYPTDTYAIVTIGGAIQRCQLNSSNPVFSCPYWTTCSGGYLVGPLATSLCETSSHKCVSDVFYPSSGAPASEKRPWVCCKSMYSGEPAPITVYSVSPTKLVISPNTTTTAPVTASSPSAPTPSSPSTSTTPGGNPMGIIVGSTIGGLVLVLGGIASWFLWSRRRRVAVKGESSELSASEKKMHEVSGEFSKQRMRLGPHYELNAGPKEQELHGETAPQELEAIPWHGRTKEKPKDMSGTSWLDD